jgi:DNA-binding transcriptional LysR family regulator
MNIQAIRLFVHVIRRGSLTAAANELNMSQSAASRVLSGLEHDTGLKLFSRQGQRLRPTVEGEQYFHECHRAMMAFDELPRSAQRLASGGRSRLKFLAGARLATVMAVPAIARFARAYPDLEIDIEVLRVQDVDRVRTGLDFDIALGVAPAGIPAVEVTALFEVPTTAVMRRDHELAKRDFVRLADLVGQRLIATAMGQTREDLERMFTAEGVDARPLYTVSSVDIGCRLALEAGGICIADPTVLLSADSEALAIVPIRPLRIVQTSLLVPTTKPESRVTRDFKDCLIEEARVVENRLSLLFAAQRAGAAN